MLPAKDRLKKLFLFIEPTKQENFILKKDGLHPEENDDKKSDNMEKKIEEKINESEKEPEPTDTIRSDIKRNLEFMKKIYSIPVNSDIVLREFDINYEGGLVKAFILFFDGMTDREIINNYILKPLMMITGLDIKENAKNLEEYIARQLLPHCQVKIEQAYSKVIDNINFGGCGFFADGVNVAFSADVKGWEHRGIDKPNNEIVIRGPQEAFNELLRTNTAQIRKRLKDEDLIVEDIVIGKVSKTPCSMLYIKDITNESLVDEVRRRLESIHTDYMLDSGVLEQLIEDSTIYPSPQMISTERPDYVSELLSNGRIAIIVNGSPNVLVAPTTALELMNSAEDTYIRYPYANLLRYIRMIALFLALLLPAIYLAITSYHQEMIPTDLLLAVEASREKVPFPSVVELLLMELSFELIREAGLRVPGPIGPTLGIIGALILGQAAVAANIVSPILIIIVAVTGIGSFAIPNYSFGYSIRIMRFGFILLSALAGFLGITAGLFVLGIWSTSLKSFGVPFMAPLGPKTSDSIRKTLFKAPEWKQEYRPDFLNTKKKKKQEKYSMGWKTRR
ncbi:MAG: spore germination protein [Clostridiaceae bacterium]